MSKPRSSFKVVKFTNKTGTYSWRVTGTDLSGKRVRANFPTQALAEGYRNQLYIADKNIQHDDNLIQTRLTKSQVRDAEQAFQALPDVSLVEAVKFYRTHYREPDRSKTVNEAYRLFLADKEKVGRRSKSIADLRSRVGRIANTHPDMMVHEITVDQLEELLTGAPQTQTNYIRTWQTFFGWAMKKGFTGNNPASVMERPSIDRGMPVVLTIDQTKDVLAKASEEGMINFVVLQLFCGLRRTEAERLSWDDVRLGKAVITVGSAVAKKRDIRTAQIPKCALAWLQPKAPLCPPGVGKKLGRLRANTGIKDRAYANCFRHTAISFHCAKHKDINLTRHWAGTGVDPIYNHYRALVDDEDTEKFWGLTPACVLQ